MGKFFLTSGTSVGCLLNSTGSWSATTLNYRMTMDIYPNLKEEVGGLILGYEISSLLEGKLARWLTASCGLALT
jgi:hypothetical protein